MTPARRQAGATAKHASRPGATRAEAAPPPLLGLRVVDLSWLLPGPFCTGLLADLGADVVKVERPGDGDYARDMLPGLFRLVNRGKRSAVFDLRRDEDRDRLLDLAADADLFVEGFRPGVVDRLGVGYRHVQQRNPGIVYVSLSGYGQSGSMSQRVGHDLNYCAQAGLLAIPSSVDQSRPYRMQLPVSDLAGGMYAALSALAALRQRDVTGRGAWLDVSLADCALAWGGVRWADAPTARKPGWRHINPGNDIFKTQDDVWLGFGLVEDKFWAAFCAAVASRSKYLRAASPPNPDQPAESLKGQRKAIAAAVARRPARFWLSLAASHDLPVTRVAGSRAELLADPLFSARGMWQPGSDGDPAYPVKVPGMVAAGAAPELGSARSRLRWQSRPGTAHADRSRPGSRRPDATDSK